MTMGQIVEGKKNCAGNTTLSLTDSQEIIRSVNLCLQPYLR